MAKVAIIPRVIPLGCGMMLIESRTRWGSYHAVDLLDEPASCSCEDEHFRKRECFHIRMARRLVAEAKKMNPNYEKATHEDEIAADFTPKPNVKEWTGFTVIE